MKKTILGYSKVNIKIPFIYKLLGWICTSLYALIDNGELSIKIALCISLVVLSLFTQSRKAKVLYVFLCVSSIAIILFWYIFDGEFLSISCQNAIVRIWLLLLIGNLFLYVVTFDEVMQFLKDLKCPKSYIVAIIVMLNAITYFIQAFYYIQFGYGLRTCKRNIFMKFASILQTLCMDFLFLLVECKKIYDMNKKHIEDAIK